MLEKIVIDFGFNCTRYGNVFGSRGSVVEIFDNQIKAAKPLTVTEPTMTRFALHINEAVNLIELALLSSEKGVIFATASPSFVVEDLVEAFFMLESYNQNIAIKKNVKVIGMAPFEKENEDLFSAEEGFRTVECGSIKTQLHQKVSTGKPIRVPLHLCRG